MERVSPATQQQPGRISVPVSVLTIAGTAARHQYRLCGASRHRRLLTRLHTSISPLLGRGNKKLLLNIAARSICKVWKLLLTFISLSIVLFSRRGRLTGNCSELTAQSRDWCCGYPHKHGSIRIDSRAAPALFPLVPRTHLSPITQGTGGSPHISILPTLSDQMSWSEGGAVFPARRSSWSRAAMLMEDVVADFSR